MKVQSTNPSSVSPLGCKLIYSGIRFFLLHLIGLDPNFHKYGWYVFLVWVLQVDEPEFRFTLNMVMICDLQLLAMVYSTWEDDDDDDESYTI